jgi:hypothetical protein
MEVESAGLDLEGRQGCFASAAQEPIFFKQVFHNCIEEESQVGINEGLNLKSGKRECSP